MKKIIFVFGSITLVSGLLFTFFSGAIVPTKYYYDVNSMVVFGGESRSRSLYYKPSQPTSNITVTVFILLNRLNDTEPITVEIWGSGVSEKQTLINWTGCRFTLPPTHSAGLIAEVDNGLSSRIDVYFIISYSARETETLTYAGLFLVALGIVESLVSFRKQSELLEAEKITKHA